MKGIVSAAGLGIQCDHFILSLHTVQYVIILEKCGVPFKCKDMENKNRFIYWYSLLLFSFLKLSEQLGCILIRTRLRVYTNALLDLVLRHSGSGS